MEAKGADAGSPADLKLVAHPRAKSKVWKYFGFDTDAEGCIQQWKKIYCRICMAQIAYSGNTSNLSYHLEKNHAEEFCEFVKSNTDQMREAFASAFSKLKPDASPQAAAAAAAGAPDALATKASHAQESRRQQELTAAVLAFLCEGLFPASVVHEATFRRLLRAADPRYELPGADFFYARALPEKYAAVRAAVQRELSRAPWCGVSMDAWRSDTQHRAYVTLGAHFLTPGGGGGAHGGGLALAWRCLRTFEVPEENAAETVARVLYETFTEWGVGAKVFGATSDHGRDLAQACALLDTPVHMPCLARSFDAGIQRALRLPRLGALLARCRRLVDYFQHSPAAMHLLAEKQGQRRARRCMLRSDRAGWWGSTLAMLQRLQEQQFVVTAVLVEDTNSHHLMLEAAEWGAMEALAELLQPFKQVADMLSASRYPAISMVRPLLHMLFSTTLSVKDTDCKEVTMAKEVIAQELSRTYQEAPEVAMFLNVATFLDPRYKKLPFLSALERQQVENRVVEEAKGLLDRGRGAGGAFRGAHEDALCAASAAPPAEDPPAKRLQLGGAPPPAPSAVINSMLAEIFCQAGGPEDQEERHAQVVEEVSNFKSQKVLGLGEDPLKWWSDRLALFPVLPGVLQKYWCVPATRVCPQRLFGSAANVVRAKRNRLAPAHVDLQVFLYENARAAAAAAEPEPEDEDEGQWGLHHDQAFAALGDPGGGAAAGFFGAREAGAFP
ncbi:E3 SUMO-protein ligase ZBED1-like [Tenrec ecaudatus]|uniref:E3 SUMO-protein ligase ZBED1-like n=1 Tax=Tenrec ecaudatus TaxID=94439 RepID=UPI003F596C59